MGKQVLIYLDEEIRPLSLSDAELSDLVEFMRSLTSDRALHKKSVSEIYTMIRVIMFIL